MQPPSEFKGSFYMPGDHLSPGNSLSDDDGFVCIGGNLNYRSDPRKLRGWLGSGNRVRNLQWNDKMAVHSTLMTVLVVDFCFQLIAVSFAQKGEDDTRLRSGFAETSLYFATISLFFYVIDMTIRIVGLQGAMFRSNSTVADLCSLVGLIAIVISRHAFQEFNFLITIAQLCILTLRLVLKPRARNFSSRFHTFGGQEKGIQVNMESVRASLRRIPGISAVAIDMMETDLVIICGRDDGFMNCDELVQFLERALLYRPRELSATEFLQYLQDVDAQSSQYAYTAFDVIKSTLKHWSSQRFDLALSVLVVCVNATIYPAQSAFIGIATNSILDNDKQGDIFYIGVIGILVLCVPFVIANYGIGYFQSKMIARATEHMQHSLLDIILSQDSIFFATRSEGDLNNLFASDIARVNALWQAVFWNLLNPLVSIVFGYAYIFYYSWPTGILAFTCTVVLLSSGPQALASEHSKEFGSLNAYVTAEFQNAVACQKVIRAYDIRRSFMKKFDMRLASLCTTAFTKDFWASVVQIYVESAMYIFIAVQLAAFLLKTREGEMDFTAFISLVPLLTRIAQPVTILGGFMRVAIGNSSSLQRIDDILNLPPRLEDKTDAPPLLPLSKSIEFRNVSFKYDKASPVFTLKNLSLTIPKGTYTCIVGPSGSGKSTVLACLMQFYSIDSGCILVDGLDISTTTKASFTAQTSVVFQEITILNGTILDNIRYGNVDATDEECMKAAELAECMFICTLKEGYQTIIGQHATTSLSGGQAQRICLARAICRRPRLLLLDECTSALDPETEASITSTLERLTKKLDTTIISVTHRLQTTVHANLILVLNNGSLVESGTYQSLQADKSSLFSDLLNFQDGSEDTALVQSSIERVSSGRFSTVSAKGTPEEEGDNRDLIEQFYQHLNERASLGGIDHTEANAIRRRNRTVGGRLSMESSRSAANQVESPYNQDRRRQNMTTGIISDESSIRTRRHSSSPQGVENLISPDRFPRSTGSDSEMSLSPSDNEDASQDNYLVL